MAKRKKKNGLGLWFAIGILFFGGAAMVNAALKSGQEGTVSLRLHQGVLESSTTRKPTYSLRTMDSPKTNKNSLIDIDEMLPAGSFARTNSGNFQVDLFLGFMLILGAACMLWVNWNLLWVKSRRK